MKILYVHGFGSAFDPTHEKVVALKTLGTVVGVDVDYCKGFDSAFDQVKEAVLSNKVDLVIGTSMGGYMAAHISETFGVPFVALNPATQPSETLKKWVGNFVSYAGKEQSLSELSVESYPDIALGGNGLVIVESADEVIPARRTKDILESFYQVEVFEGGGHRFTHIDKALPLIDRFVNSQVS